MYVHQVALEGVRGAGIEGDIALDDVTIQEGPCKDPPSNSESERRWMSGNVRWLPQG